jgi:hypothetical protein
MSAKTRTQHIACDFLQYAPQARFWGKVRSGEVRGDRVGKAAPAGRPKSDCAHNKPEKYGASMAALEHHLEKWQPVFRKDDAPPKTLERRSIRLVGIAL